MSVREIQQALAAAGFNPGPIDGVMGPKTRAAIKAFQQARGLTVDGVVGPQTTAALQGGGGAPAASNPDQATKDAYPQFSWLYNDPELGPVLRQAAAEGWTDTRLEGAIQQTNWWKTHAESARNYLQLAATDPAEATRRLNNYDSITKYMGLAADYGLPMSFQNAAGQVDRVVRGEIAPDALTQELRIQAKALYPQLAQQIDQGATVADVYAPYRQMAADILGVNAATINLSDPKWQAPLQVRESNGTTRLATTSEWQSILRSDPRYGYNTSANGRQEAAQFATLLGQKFGALA